MAREWRVWQAWQGGAFCPQFDAKIPPLLRPLLGISRAEIEQYAQQHQLEVLLDETNVEPVYYRNQLRLSLIPPEMEALNPGFKQSVLRAAEVLRVDNLLLEKLEAQAFRQVVGWQSENEIVLNREAFCRLTWLCSDVSFGVG